MSTRTRLIDDEGNVLHTFDEEYAFLTFDPDGTCSVIIPHLADNPEEIVPSHVMAAVKAMVYLADNENAEDVTRYFDIKSKGAH